MNDVSQQIREDAIKNWNALQPHRFPGREQIGLWTAPSGAIFLDNKFGPAVPYPPVPRTDRESNFGYVKLKGNLSAVGDVPELRGWPELQGFVSAINGDDSPMESVGCAIGFFLADDQTDAKHFVGSYVDVIFSDPVHAELPTSYLVVASTFMAALDGCEKWWSNLEIALQPLAYLAGTQRPFGITLRFKSYGRTQDEARELFSVTMKRAVQAVKNLSPSDEGAS